MLGVTGAIVGAGLADDVALLTDGRFSGATREPWWGTLLPRRRWEGPSRQCAGDIISINVETRTMDLEISSDRLAALESWAPPAPKYTSGVFQKYVKLWWARLRRAVTS
jgi:dihydroxy-acid dehydratase